MISYGGFPVGVPFNMKFGKKTTVCYIVENIDLGHIPARLLGDEQITKVLKGHDALIDEYFLEENKSKRETSEHIFPLLKKAGIIE